MEVRVQSVKFDAAAKLIDFAKKKVGKLGRFFDGIIAADVTMSLTQDYDNKKVAIRLEIPGYDLMTEKQSATFEKAIVECVDVLKVQIKKTKEKMCPINCKKHTHFFLYSYFLCYSPLSLRQIHTFWYSHVVFTLESTALVSEVNIFRIGITIKNFITHAHFRGITVKLVTKLRMGGEHANSSAKLGNF